MHDSFLASRSNELPPKFLIRRVSLKHLVSLIPHPPMNIGLDKKTSDISFFLQTLFQRKLEMIVLTLLMTSIRRWYKFMTLLMTFHWEIVQMHWVNQNYLENFFNRYECNAFFIPMCSLPLYFIFKPLRDGVVFSATFWSFRCQNWVKTFEVKSWFLLFKLVFWIYI